MASDFNAASQNHGEKIRLERNIMEIYGVTRTQARRALKGIGEFQQRIELLRAQQPQPTIQQWQGPNIVSTEIPTPKLQPIGGAAKTGAGKLNPVNGTAAPVRIIVGGVATDVDFLFP